MNLLGLILSGGKSSRMGIDKGMMPYKGKHLVEYSIAHLSRHTTNIVISANDSAYAKFGRKLIPDLIPGIGPIGGLYSVFKEENFDYCLVHACDLPNASYTLTKKMLDYIHEYDIIVPLNDNRPEPLLGIYSMNIFKTIEGQILTGDYKLQNLIKKCNSNYYKINKQEPWFNVSLFKNINTPEDATE